MNSFLRIPNGHISPLFFMYSRRAVTKTKEVNLNVKLKNKYSRKKVNTKDVQTSYESEFNLKVASLIKQAQHALKSKTIFPYYHKLIPSFVNILQHKCFYPEINEDDVKLITDVIPYEHEYTDLLEILENIRQYNDKVEAFSDISTISGEVGHFLRLNDKLQKANINFKIIQSGSIMQSPIIYENVLRYFSSTGDWSSFNCLFQKVQKNHIKTTKNMYFYALECLGRLVQKYQLDSSLSSLPRIAHSQFSLSSFCNLSPSKILDEIDGHVEFIFKKAEIEGHNLTTNILDLPFRKGTVEAILTAVRRIKQDYTLSVDCFSTCNSHTHSIHSAQRCVDNAFHEMKNPYATCFATVEHLKKAFCAQLELECQLEVLIPPVLSRFSSLEISESKKNKVSDELQRLYYTGLMNERRHWYHTLKTGFRDLLKRLQIRHSRGELTAYPFLKILPVSEYIDLLLSSVDMLISNSDLQYTSKSLTCLKLGQFVERACMLYRKKQLGIHNQVENIYTVYSSLYNESNMTYPTFREMWNCAQQNQFGTGPNLNQKIVMWPSSVHMLVGQTLFNLVYDRLNFNINGPVQVRLEASKKGDLDPMKRQDAPIFYEIHPTLINWYKDAEYPPMSFHPCALPMLCPPIPWTNLDDAGYLISRNYATRLFRLHDGDTTNTNLLMDMDFDYKKIVGVLDALNCLSACSWRVNNKILDYMIHLARLGGNEKLSLPEWKKITAPKFSFDYKNGTPAQRRAAARKYREEVNEYERCRSLWSNELHRLSIANHYRDKIFWFPHSMDFRGRVYPCPPHFNHMGSDVARGLIQFATSLPLGSKGLDWLKIHLINLTGLKKRCSNDQRLEYADSIMDDIIDSAEKPFHGRRWWQNHEDAWQILACCKEINKALNHPAGPESYPSSLPVHQDGSCNGLQHYAALGRDERGAKCVSLSPLEFPQDVYSDVVEKVEEQRRLDAANGNEIAKILEGFVTRKVIKRSIMTTVYGVTHYGAVQQITNQLKDIKDFPKEPWMSPAAQYLATLTLASIGKIFTSSRVIQNWFSAFAHEISQNLGVCMSWESPLGLPIIQPYLQQPKSYQQFKPLIDYSASIMSPEILKNVDSSTDNCKVRAKYLTSTTLKPNAVKQRNAFAPNFIHSLDSCHMMLTALHCFKAGIVFASVHDCFWTHAATVDEMNRICREEFVALHSEPILNNLSDYLQRKFAYSEKEIGEMVNAKKKSHAIAFNKLIKNVPKKGTFDLNEVLKSTYFFS